MPPPAVSVVLSTFNRATSLDGALAALVAQAPGSPPHEILVVDNNSTDTTSTVVARHARTCESMHYLFEPRQGLSYARNAGIAAAAAPIVAFTDDDVRASAGWVSAIARAFEAHPDVSCLGGRTLPVWPVAPPRWLTSQHWGGPLALQDYGTSPLLIHARHFLCLNGANLAVRKSVFERVGLFDPKFPRAQDTEFLLRMYKAGGRSLYVPEMRVDAVIDAARMTKSYYRKWHLNIGRCNTRMGFQELCDPGVGLREAPPHFARMFGIPRFAFRQFASDLAGWLAMTARFKPAEAFSREKHLWELLGYFFESRAADRSKPGLPSRNRMKRFRWPGVNRTTDGNGESWGAHV